MAEDIDDDMEEGQEEGEEGEEGEEDGEGEEEEHAILDRGDNADGVFSQHTGVCVWGGHVEWVDFTLVLCAVNEHVCVCI